VVVPKEVASVLFANESPLPTFKEPTAPLTLVERIELSIPEIIKLVVLAVVAVIAVVDAYGIESAEVRGAENVIDGETDPTTENDAHEIPAVQDAEEVATDW